MLEAEHLALALAMSAAETEGARPYDESEGGSEEEEEEEEEDRENADEPRQRSPGFSRTAARFDAAECDAESARGTGFFAASRIRRSQDEANGANAEARDDAAMHRKARVPKKAEYEHAVRPFVKTHNTPQTTPTYERSLALCTYIYRHL